MYYVKYESYIIFASENYDEALQVLKQYQQAELEYLRPILKAKTKVRTVNFDYFRFASSSEIRLIEELIPNYQDLSIEQRPTAVTILVLDEADSDEEELLKVLSVVWEK